MVSVFDARIRPRRWLNRVSYGGRQRALCGNWKVSIHCKCVERLAASISTAVKNPCCNIVYQSAAPRFYSLSALKNESIAAAPPLPHWVRWFFTFISFTCKLGTRLSVCAAHTFRLLSIFFHYSYPRDSNSVTIRALTAFNSLSGKPKTDEPAASTIQLYAHSAYTAWNNAQGRIHRGGTTHSESHPLLLVFSASNHTHNPSSTILHIKWDELW